MQDGNCSDAGRPTDAAESAIARRSYFMPDFDTDPKMMREQQNRDTPEDLTRGEGRREAADSDADSRRQRREAIAGKGDGEEQMEAILRQNRQVGRSGEGSAAQAGHPKKGLVRRGRSLLGG